MATSKKPVLLFVIAALVLGLMGWTLSKQRGHKSQDAEAVALEDAQPVPLRQRTAPPLVGISPDDPGSIFAKPVDPVERAREEKRIVADFEQKFNAEPVDAAWAGRAEPALAKILDDEGIAISGLKPASYRADCRSNQCRISAVFGTHADADDWGTMYMNMTGETFHETRSMLIRQPDGTTELRIYGYRKR